MDNGNKIYIIIMCGPLFRIIRKHGVKCQFESIPGVGCKYGTSTIKTILNLRHNQNLPTWVEFSDLVKAFDNSNHTLPISIMGNYGAPPRLCPEIKRMYKKSAVKLITGKIETSIYFKVGVKQVDIMTPLLFLFLIMAFDETLEDKWTDLGLSKSQFPRKENSPRSSRQFMSHQTVTFSSGTIFNILCMLYVDESVFVFE